ARGPARRNGKAHAIENILMAFGREYLVDMGEIPCRGRLTAPQFEHLRKMRRDMFGGAMRAPIGLLASAEHIMELQKLADAVPAIAEQLVEAAGMDIHRRAVGGKIVGERTQRQFDQDDRRRLERLDEARRQPDRHAIPFPEARTVAGAEADMLERHAERLCL